MSTRGQPQPQPSAFDDLMSKKGFKSNDDFAKSYGEAEASLGRSQNAHNTAKQQLETQGYTMDDSGNITPVQTQPGAQVQPVQQVTPGQQNPGQQQQTQADPIYDPYTGQQITNPVDVQLAQMPLSQRMSVVVNSIVETRDQQQREASTVETEILTSPEAKGFEEDTRRVMMQLPLAQRTKKESWQDALLKVKGMKYDDALKNAGTDGVNAFLNKEQNQAIPSGAPAGDGTVVLTPEQETTYKYYEQNHPTMFKDRAHFIKRDTQVTG